MTTAIPAFIKRVLSTHGFSELSDGSMEIVKPLVEYPYLLRALNDDIYHNHSLVHTVVTPDLTVKIAIEGTDYEEAIDGLGTVEDANGPLLDAGVPAFGLKLINDSVSFSGGKSIPEDGELGSALNAWYHWSSFEVTPQGYRGVASMSLEMRGKRVNQVVFASPKETGPCEIHVKLPKVNTFDVYEQITKDIGNFKLLLTYVFY